MYLQIIGYGNMAKAIMQSLDLWKQENARDDVQVTILDRKDISAELTQFDSYVQQGINITADCILVAVKPQSLDSVDLSGFSDTAVGISILAGTSFETLTNHKKFLAWIRCMPSVLMHIGAGSTGWVQQGVHEHETIKMMKQIFARSGTVIDYNEEEQLADHAALFGSGPAYIPMVMQLLAQAAQTLDLGLSEKEIQQGIHEMVLGTISYMQQEAITGPELMARVLSKGGTTQAFREKLQAAGGEEIFVQAMLANKKRSQELDM